MEAGEKYDSKSTDNTNSTGVRRFFRNKKNEKAPLLSQKRLFRSLSGRGMPNSESTAYLLSESDPLRTLGTFAGVFAPVSLSQFSTLLFLRVGFIIGSAGLLVTCGTLTLAYIILLFTILSICAISTNGAVEGGGAYYMISRTLGPEFGGAIGALFFFANIFSSALYTTGCVEGILESFGLEAGDLAIYKFLPEGDWYNFAYASLLNGINLLICFIGAGMFAKTTVAILVVVLICTTSVIISFLAFHHIIQVPIPANNEQYHNMTGSYTGLSVSTFNDNLYPEWMKDYTTGNVVDFATVFSVLFSGITGIMAGANMSGELKKPGRNIPVGTLLASAFTFCVYTILFVLTAATSSRFLLQNNYSFMIGINIWPPFVAIGVFTATISASLSNIIGASRVLAALVKDNIYGGATRWIGWASFGSNPIGAVLVSGLFVEGVLLIGQLNTIARFTSVFFLLSYLATNIACLSLEWASAPNFRPTFRYFSWWTAGLGIVSNAAMMIVVSAIYSAVCIIICLILIIILHIRSPSEHHKWGSISQALIFHQVRKYLLLLDSRKDHVKFWRPQILLLVADPKSACPLIDFVNDLKKSGLYILGHVKIEEFKDDGPDPTGYDYPRWQCLVDHLKVKAFIEVTVADSVRVGMQQLARVAGLGAMKPNTIILGFLDDTPPQDFFSRLVWSHILPTVETPERSTAMQVLQERDRDSSSFYVAPPTFSSTTEGQNGSPCATSQGLLDWQQESMRESLQPHEYVAMIRDVLNMGKNVCLCRHFHLLDKDAILKKSGPDKPFIDVWPMDFFRPDEVNVFDTSSLFLMQLATVLNMVAAWKKRTQLRVFLCVSTATADPERQKQQVWNMLRELRIQATVATVSWSHVSSLSKPCEEGAISECGASGGTPTFLDHLTENYLKGVNQMVRENSLNTAVTFMYLPYPPSYSSDYPGYMKALTTLTQHLYPTILVHGVSAVTTTNL